MPIKKCAYCGETFVYSGKFRRYCFGEECQAKRKIESSRQQTLRNMITYKNPFSSKHSGKKKCATPGCKAIHNNHYSWCNACWEQRASQYDSSFIIIGHARRNGSPILQ